jgi:hypothetical protein
MPDFFSSYAANVIKRVSLRDWEAAIRVGSLRVSLNSAFGLESNRSDAIEGGARSSLDYTVCV